MVINTQNNHNIRILVSGTLKDSQIISGIFDSLISFENSIKNREIVEIFDTDTHGSDTATRMMLGTDEISVGSWLFKSIDPNSDYQSWLTEDNDRVISREDSNIKSIFTFTYIDHDQDRNIVPRNGVPTRFATNFGDIKRAKSMMEKHYRSLQTLLRNNKYSRIRDVNQYGEPVDSIRPDAESTHNQNMNMACFFMTMSLYLNNDKYWETVRKLIGVSGYHSFKRTLMDKGVTGSIPRKLNKYLYCNKVRGSSLVPYMVYLINDASDSHNWDKVTSSSSLTEAQIAYVLLKLGIYTVIVNDGDFNHVIQQTSGMILKQPSYVPSQGEDLRNFTNKKIYTFIDPSGKDTEYKINSRKNVKERKKLVERPISLLFRVTNTTDKEAHIEIERSPMITMHCIERCKRASRIGCVNKSVYTLDKGKLHLGNWVNGLWMGNKLNTSKPKYGNNIDFEPDPGAYKIKRNYISEHCDMLQIKNKVVGNIRDAIFNEKYDDVYIFSKQAFLQSKQIMELSKLDQCINIERGYSINDPVSSLHHMFDKIYKQYTTKLKTVKGKTPFRIGTEFKYGQSDTLKRNHRQIEERIRLDELLGRDSYMEIDNECLDESQSILSVGVETFTLHQILVDEDHKATGIQPIIFKYGERDTNDIVIEKVVEAHLSGKHKFQIVSNIRESGLKLIEKMKKEREQNEKTGDQHKNKTIDIWLENSKDEKYWILEKFRTDKTMRNMMYAEIGGDNIMDRVSSIDSPDVENIKLCNKSSYEFGRATVSTYAEYISENQVLNLFDISSEYASIAKGGCNQIWNKDKFGMDPQFMTPRNPSSQNIIEPLDNYFKDCGTINIYPKRINTILLNELAPTLINPGTTLYHFVTDKQRMTGLYTSSVLSSVEVISLTMDAYKYRSEKYKQYTFNQIAKIFQFDVLHIKTGRFSFNKDERACIHKIMNDEFDEYEKENNCRIMEDGPDKYTPYKCTIFNRKGLFSVQLYESIKYAMKHRLVIVNPGGNKPLLKLHNGTVCISGEAKDEIEKYDGLLKSAMYGTIKLFILFADLDLRLRMLGLENSVVKKFINSSIGSFRQCHQLGYDMLFENVITEKKKRGDKYYIDVSKNNPNIQVVSAVLEESEMVLLSTVLIRHSPVRMVCEPFRDYILIASRQITNCIAMELPVDDPIIQCRTDSFLVSVENSKKVHKILSWITRDKPDSSKYGLPGESTGYTCEIITPEERMDPAHKLYCLNSRPISHEYFHVVDNKKIPYSIEPIPELKSILDEPKVLERVTDVGLLKRFYDEPVHESLSMGGIIKTYGELLEGFTKDDIKDDIAIRTSDMVNINSPKYNKNIDTFMQQFTIYEINYLLGYMKILLTGGPGCGKTYTMQKLKIKLEEIAKRKCKKGDNLYSIFFSSYHSLVQSMKPFFEKSSTIHSLMRSCRDIKQNCLDPYTTLCKNSPWKAKLDYAYALFFDEVTTYSRYMEEPLKLINWMRPDKRIILCGDTPQLGAIKCAGVDLNGDVVKSIVDIEYVKTIERRNFDSGYLKAKNETRRGNIKAYLDDTICDLYKGDKAETYLLDTISTIVKDIYTTGKTSTTIVVQNRCISGMCVMVIVRLLLKLGIKYDHALISLRDEKKFIHDKNKINQSVINCFNPDFKANKPTDQENKFVPLLMVQGMEYSCVYRCQPTYKGYREVKDESTDEIMYYEQITIFKTDILTYLSSSVENLKVKKDKKVINKKNRVYRFLLNGDETVYLTELEVATCLYYTFVAQRVGLIGLTLDKVVVLQIATPYNESIPYTGSYPIGYTPIEKSVCNISDKFGEYAVLTNLSRSLQVVLTRVKTGEKTIIIDLSITKYYEYLNADSVFGEFCGGLGTLFTVSDRECIQNSGGINLEKVSIGYRSTRDNWRSILAGILHEKQFFKSRKINVDMDKNEEYEIKKFVIGIRVNKGNKNPDVDDTESLFEAEELDELEDDEIQSNTDIFDDDVDWPMGIDHMVFPPEKLIVSPELEDKHIYSCFFSRHITCKRKHREQVESVNSKKIKV